MRWRDLSRCWLFLRGAPPAVFFVAPRSLGVLVGESRSGRPFTRGGSSSWLGFAVGLGAGCRCGDRGVEDGAALCNFGGALRHQPPHVFRRHPGVAPGRPHVRLANAEGPFGYKLALPRAILREGGPFGEGGRGAARARLAEVLELALE